MRKFFKEFKAFIARGNVLDMAVGVIIGGAFSAIVTAFTNNIIRPVINWVLFLIFRGEENAPIYTMLHTVLDEEGKIDYAASIYIDWGSFISAIINFILIALVLFLIIKAFNRVAQAAKVAKDLKAKKEAGLPLTKREQKKLAAILAIEEKEALEAKKAEEEALKEAAKPTKDQELLMEIRDLLAKK